MDVQDVGTTSVLAVVCEVIVVAPSHVYNRTDKLAPLTRHPVGHESPVRVSHQDDSVRVGPVE